MSAVYLSRTGRTEHPFYISSVSRNLYSVEELLHFLRKNPELIDEEVQSPALTRWLVSEFHLADAALKMERGLRTGKSASEFVLPLFREMGWLTPPELRTYARELDLLSQASYEERLTRKAEALFRNRRYGEALAVYHQAESSADPGQKELMARIYKGEGCSLMQLLAADEAVQAFEKAMRAAPSPSIKRMLLTSLRLAKPEELFLLRAEELGASEELLQEIDEGIRKAGEETVCPEDPEEELARIRSAYHEESGS